MKEEKPEDVTKEIAGEDAKKETKQKKTPLKELEALRKKDRIYFVEGVIDRLLATPNPKTTKMLQMPNKVKCVILDSFQTEYGSEGKKGKLEKTREKIRTIKGRQEIPLFCFERFNGHNGDAEGEGISYKVGGDFGLIHQGLYRVVEAMRKGRFWNPPIDLIKVLPERMSLGSMPPERTKAEAVFILEPRSRGTTRQLVAYEAIEDRPIKFFLIVNSACPLGQSEIVSMMHGLETVRIGSGRRGHLTVTNIEEKTSVDLSDFELPNTQSN